MTAKQLTNKDLLKLGFKTIPHYTIGNQVKFDLGRNRHLSATDLGGGNETLWICATDRNAISDLVCLHNRDYDGPLTIEKVQALIGLLESKRE